MEDVLEHCLSRVPKAHMVICVSLDSREVLGQAELSAEHRADAEQLGRSACDLFGSVPLTGSNPDDLGEALVAGPEGAVIFLRCKSRGAAIAYSVARDNDLGMALASSRLTLPDIEAAIEWA